MAKLSILPPKPGRATTQLVRYPYSAQHRRTVTVYVGSLRLDADPEYAADDLVLNEGEQLTNDEHRQIYDWLIQHGDKRASQRRYLAAKQVAEDTRMRCEEEFLKRASTRQLDPFEAAIEALNALSAHFGTLKEQDVAAAKARYVALLKVQKTMVESAQKARVARMRNRGSAETA
jgi:hypothetical protein